MQKALKGPFKTHNYTPALNKRVIPCQLIDWAGLELVVNHIEKRTKGLNVSKKGSAEKNNFYLSYAS